MSKKYKNKYRIKSARLPNWDYGNNGMYFITICTQNREYFFGEIENNQMVFSEIGKIVIKYWSEISIQFPFVKLGKFVVMPNHIHGILIIDKMNDMGANTNTTDVETRLIASLPKPKSKPKPPNQSPSINNIGGITGNNNPMFHDNISRIIRWYKGRCSFEIHKTTPYFAWQSRFYDHIIRNEKSFHIITNYIVNNPKKWMDDKFYNQNIDK